MKGSVGIGLAEVKRYKERGKTFQDKGTVCTKVNICNQCDQMYRVQDGEK